MDKFTEDRKKTLAEIRAFGIERIKDLAKSPTIKKANFILPEFMEAQENYKWPTMLHGIAEMLERDRPLKDVFATFAGKPQQYDTAPRQHASGRDSAVDDVIRVLDAALRDFDQTYKPLTRDQMDYWLKKHPIGKESMELAYKENQRHFMKESIDWLKNELGTLRVPPSARPSFKGPKP